MKKRSLVALILGSITSILAIAMGVISFLLDSYLFYAGITLFLAGAVSLIGSLVGFYYHDRFGGIITIGSSALYFFALSIFNMFYVSFFFFQDLWINAIVMLFVLAILVTSLLLIYRIPSKGQEYDNSIFKDHYQHNYLALVGSIITVGLLAYVTVQLFTIQFYLTSIACIITIFLLISGVLISFLFKTRFGSLIMTMSLWFAFFGTVVEEINSTSNLTIILMILAQTMLVATVLLEWFDIISIQERERE